ncbi:hypothetical protein M3Y99_01076000 [Aphelenchoides fujianensis]|nr:hypothetical protein M3Y99_01076000 [Aphelenchoides fujianensis]
MDVDNQQFVSSNAIKRVCHLPQKQIAFLSNQVFTDEWTNLERLVLVPYNQRAFEQTFTADNTAADVRQQLAQLTQSRPSNLSTLFAVLDSWQQQPAESPVHLLVFVSRIDQAAVDASRPSVRSLQQKNYALTFVAVGGQLDAALFLQLSPNLIQWDVNAQNVPAGWTQQFWTAYGKHLNFKINAFQHSGDVDEHFDFDFNFNAFNNLAHVHKHFDFNAFQHSIHVNEQLVFGYNGKQHKKSVLKTL